MHSPNYLFLSRHNLYYFRFPIPKEFHPDKQRSEVKLSLNTRNPQEALQITRGLIYFAQNIIHSPAIRDMEYQEIRDVLQSYFVKLREELKARIAKNGQLTEQDITSYRNGQALANTALVEKDYSVIGQNEVSDFIHSQQLDVLDTGTFETIRTEWLKAYGSYCESALEYNSRFDKYQFRTDPAALAMRAAISKSARYKLADKIEDFIAEKLRLGDWSEKSSRGFRAELTMMSEYLGKDCNLNIDPETAKDVIRTLFVIPKNSRSNPNLKTLSINELVALNVPQAMRMSKRSIAKYVDTFIAFYDWAVNNKLVSENNFKSLKIRVNKEQVRDMFTKEQLAVIINELKTGKRGLIKKDYQKWGGLILVYTGARLNEIAQLELKDIKQVEDIWCFDINNEEDKKLKNRASKRLVPIHKDLIALGLLEYVQQLMTEKKQRLLYELTWDKNNGYGRNLGRWFNGPFLKTLGFKKASIVLHSTRHSIITYLVNADIPVHIAKHLVGHKQGGVFDGNYFKGYTIKQLKDAIDSVYQDLPSLPTT
jgi:integrase